MRFEGQCTVLGVGTEGDVSFLDSLDPTLVLYVAGTLLGDEIKKYCEKRGLDYRPVQDEDTKIIDVFCGFRIGYDKFMEMAGYMRSDVLLFYIK